ncbi:hydroxyglutarate oxidase [Nocardioides flavus (ex Wang et al. 2016)]|uniref:Hydroxyglutarate oxidase n=1 Tax=Nocardioides flavus (ex Wang et al. 2016) TaxID=2058780 RepID=A0ABQ3HGB2_9ACTN|nr:L-2-hydroxyglutarate oxidase [Nocardioides flavus (ex Wang et al. 2016)]GHE15538.1 hydroxyglutarate oxidase [Nocardioides flavus (ex Wang et al. 2016)]
MSAASYAVVGGGILGAAVARRLQVVDPDASVTVWEKEDRLAAHQTGRNSGVVHAGLYYEPGSLKATLCRRGVGLLREFCEEHDIAYDACGKVLVALDEVEEGRLGAIEAKALANGVPGIRRISGAELREIEPHVRGVAGLHSPSTAIVDYPGVTRRLAELVEADGGTVRLSTELVGIRQETGGVVLTGRTPAGTVEERVDRVVLCTGLWADRTAGQAGDTSDPRVVPFRGEYLLLRPERRSLVNGLVYPVPDPRYPFLGVHLTPRVDGEVMVGPNAVLALAREGYDWRTVSARDLREVVAYDGFRRFARQHWRTGVAEMAGSLSRRRFVAAARRYVPELRLEDVVDGPSGIRAQAMERTGELVDDFRISTRDRVTALRNAPSPAATSSLAIAEHVVDVVLGREVAR